MNQTNTSNGLQVPGLDYLPPSWQGPALMLIALSPYITRAYHALSMGGGIKGVMSAIWLGTNVPKPTPPPAPENKQP